jgi:hypothetical protein
MPSRPSWGQPAYDQPAAPEPVPDQSGYPGQAWGQRAYDQAGSTQPSWGQHAAYQPASEPVPGQPGYPAQVWGQAYGQPGAIQPAWGQHASGREDGQPGYPQQRPDDNPYHVTPAQYYRDHGYAPQEPVEPYPMQARPSRPWSRTERSSAVGMVSFGLVAAMTVVCVFAAQSLGEAYAKILLAVGSLDVDTSNIPEGLVSPAVGPTLTLGAASIAGIGGLIVGIVAAVSGRGRGWGIGAIILGLLAPVIWFTVMMAILMPVAETLS